MADTFRFTSRSWSDIRERYESWWHGEIEHPIIAIRVRRGTSSRCHGRHPFQRFTSNYPTSTKPIDIVESWRHELKQFEYLGDAFPMVMPDFGPGVLAAYLGCNLYRGAETAWFHPPREVEPDQLHLTWNPDEYWFQRTVDICRAAVEHFQGEVQISPPDLGGVMDVLASFRPSGGLLTDLYDYPQEIKRLNREVHELWFRYYHEINGILSATNPGYTCWTPLLSDQPYWMLQCDFSYMIGPEMFAEFALPELVASSEKLARPFYHLDGPGQLDKLDRILAIADLKGIQWIPGAGQPEITEWPAVLRKIRDAGKLIQIFTFQSEKGFRILDDIVSQLGSSRGIALIGEAKPEEIPQVQEMIRRYR